MRQRTADALRDALQQIAIIQTILKQTGYSYSRFASDQFVRSTMLWQFHTLGMALRRIATADEKDLYGRCPGIKMAIDNQTAFGKQYDSLDLEVVWSTVIEDLDPLRMAIRRELRQAGEALDSSGTP